MIALILVAGNSRRMGELTANCHKTLLDTGGKSILHRMLDALISQGITEICLVCGYRKEELQDNVLQHYPDLKATWIENPVFDSTNTAYSVWLTRDTLAEKGQDVLLINGDVVLDARSIAATLAVPDSTVLAARLDRVAEEEVKVRLDDNGCITEIGKHIPPEKAAGESVGINRLAAEMLPGLYQVLDKRIRTGNGKSEFYEAAFNELIQSGEKFQIADITHLPVMEVDTPEDYEAVLAEVVPLLQN